MTIALESLGDGSVSDRNFHKLAQQALDAGGTSASIRFGTATMTWPGGSQFSSLLAAVAHGLGKAPRVVLLTSNAPTAFGFMAWTGALGATTFSIQAWTPSAAPGAGATEPVSWLAVG